MPFEAISREHKEATKASEILWAHIRPVVWPIAFVLRVLLPFYQLLALDINKGWGIQVQAGKERPQTRYFNVLSYQTESISVMPMPSSVPCIPIRKLTGQREPGEALDYKKFSPQQHPLSQFIAIMCKLRNKAETSEVQKGKLYILGYFSHRTKYWVEMEIYWILFYISFKEIQLKWNWYGIMLI